MLGVLAAGVEDVDQCRWWCRSAVGQGRCCGHNGGDIRSGGRGDDRQGRCSLKETEVPEKIRIRVGVNFKQSDKLCRNESIHC